MSTHAQKRLREVAREVKRITDGQGTPIDREIRPIVVALRAFHVDTSGSCQGHIGHGAPFPWVDIDDHHSWVFDMLAKMYARQRCSYDRTLVLSSGDRLASIGAQFVTHDYIAAHRCALGEIRRAYIDEMNVFARFLRQEMKHYTW